MTKTVRMNTDDAFIVEQTVRELAAELSMEVKGSQFLKELIKYVPQAKKDFEEKIRNTGRQ